MNRTRLVSALAMAALAAILLPSTLTAQITFERTYGGADEDFGTSVQQTSDGGFIATGYTYSYGAGELDLWLIKTDANGDTMWTRTFGGDNDEFGHSVQLTRDGGYIVAGETRSFGYSDFYLVKTDEDGDETWTRVISSGHGGDLGNSVQQAADGGYVIAGTADADDLGFGLVCIARTDSCGETLWTRTFGTGMDYGYSVQQTVDGGFIVAGGTRSFGAGSCDVWLLKVSSDGETLWTKTYGGAQYDCGFSVQITAESGFAIAGCLDPGNTGGGDVYLVRTDERGDTLWTRTYGGSQYDIGYSVGQTADGGYIIAGSTNSLGAGRDDVYLIKTNAVGDTFWTRTFGGVDDDWASSVQQTADGGYIIAGVTESYGSGNADFYLIKTDSMGNVAVAEPNTSPTRAPALSLTCTPNPASGSVTISLSPSIPLSLSPILRVYDSQGRMVLSREVSTSPFPLPTSDLPSGAYFARLDAGGQHATTRIVLQR